jgi:hypothetical protein
LWFIFIVLFLWDISLISIFEGDFYFSQKTPSVLLIQSVNFRLLPGSAEQRARRTGCF